MLAKGICPTCKKEFLMSICVECFEDHPFQNDEEARQYIIENVTVKIPAENGLHEFKLIEVNE